VQVKGKQQSGTNIIKFKDADQRNRYKTFNAQEQLQETSFVQAHRQETSNAQSQLKETYDAQA